MENEIKKEYLGRGYEECKDVLVGYVSNFYGQFKDNKNFNLNCKEFEKYIIEDRLINNGKQYIFKFENKYGASVVKNIYSYGYDNDLWELAIIKFNNDESFEIIYDSELSDDVLGYLTDEKVVEYLKQIKELK